MTAVVIAVVDDDHEVRSGIANLLRSLDYTVHTFASTENFLTSPQLHQAACVISDVRMPGLSGIELLEILNAEGPHIPIVLITAHLDEQTRDHAMRAGAVAFLGKPLSAEDLVRCLVGALKKV